MIEKLNLILRKLLSGDLSVLSPDNIILVSSEAVRILNKDNLDDYDVMSSELIINISQIVYNNTDKSVLFLDDGIYDLLLEKFKNYRKDFQVGAPVIKFDQDGEIQKEQQYTEIMTFLEDADNFIENSLYYNDIIMRPPIDINRLDMKIDRNSGKSLTKRNINVPHMYPKLVGSLDKCKFTLNKEAIERDVFEDDNVKVFERDFLAKHLQMGIIDMNTPFELVAELKYDGVSVEADVTDHIISARSRGDANNDVAADLTEILG